jgi:hypothetical protein
VGEDYLKLDLSPNGEVAKNLFDRVQVEAASHEIVLTGDGDPGSWSENLTPSMSSWFSLTIAPVRQRMLGQIDQFAKGFRLGNKDGEINGIFYGMEIDRVDRHVNWDICKLYTDFKEKYGSDLAGKAQLSRDYGRMRGEIGRDAINKSFIQQAAPPALAGIVEGFFNYSNLIEVLPTGLISLGVTLVIMLVVAVGVHFLGKGLAERGFRSEGSRHEKNKNLAFIIGGFATLLLILAIVFAIRYVGLQEEVQNAELIGIEPPNIALTVIQLIGFNLAIYLVGVLMTAKQYDPNPEFAKIAEDLNDAESEIASLKKRHVYDPKAKLIDKTVGEKRKLKEKARQMDGMPGYAELQELINQLETQDARVIGLLTEYRNRLAQAIQARDSAFRFKKNTAQSFPDDDGEDLSLAAFAAARLYIYKAEA